MSQYIVNCTSSTNCTMVPYNAPPETVYALGPEWGLLVAAVVIIAIIIGVAIVRYKAHEEKGITDRRRIDNPPKQCSICGAEATA